MVSKGAKTKPRRWSRLTTLVSASGREKMARQDCCPGLRQMAKDERFLFSSMVATTAKIAILTSYYGEKSLRVGAQRG